MVFKMAGFAFADAKLAVVPDAVTYPFDDIPHELPQPSTRTRFGAMARPHFCCASFTGDQDAFDESCAEIFAARGGGGGGGEAGAGADEVSSEDAIDSTEAGTSAPAAKRTRRS